MTLIDLIEQSLLSLEAGDLDDCQWLLAQARAHPDARPADISNQLALAATALSAGRADVAEDHLHGARNAACDLDRVSG